MFHNSLLAHGCRTLVQMKGSPLRRSPPRRRRRTEFAPPTLNLSEKSFVLVRDEPFDSYSPPHCCCFDDVGLIHQSNHHCLPPGALFRNLPPFPAAERRSAIIAHHCFGLVLLLSSRHKELGRGRREEKAVLSALPCPLR